MTQTPSIKIIKIPGEPVAKARPRMTKEGRAYTPAKTRAWEKMAAQVIALSWGNAPKIDRPICMTIVAVFPRTMSRPKRVSKEEWDSGLRTWRPAKPDLDNIVKAVLDAAQLSGVLADDLLVVGLSARKMYAGLNDDPKVLVLFEEVD